MLTDEEVDLVFALIRDRIDRVNDQYLREVGEQIKAIGELNPSSIRKLAQMRRFGASSERMRRELRRMLRLSQAEIDALYKKAVDAEYADAAYALTRIGKDISDPTKNRELRTYVEAVSRQTELALNNWSNTTVLDEAYKQIISDAVDAVSRGVTDYKSAIRKSIAGYDGLKVKYESGLKRRLDTAVRQNILDGTRQISQKCAEMIGEEIGADGVELSAHPYSALDHEPCQGRQYTKENYEKMQSEQAFVDVDGNYYSAFRRPITQWNCRHFASPILVGISPRRYTDTQLAEWKRANHKGCDIDGKHYTIYQASQLMRNLEAEVRRQKDIANLCKASGDDVGRRNAQWQITLCKAQYQKVSQACGLSQRPEKMMVKGYAETAKESALFANDRGITKKKPPMQDAYRINSQFIDSNAYKRKFAGITGNSATDDAIFKYSKAALHHRDGTDREDLYILSGKTGDVLGKNVTSTESHGVGINKSVMDAVTNHQGDLIGLHTHPDGTPPTGSDFEVAFGRGYNLGVVANATGDVYLYRQGKEYISAKFIDSTIEKYKKMVDKTGRKVYSNGVEAHLAALDQLRKDYGIWYETR